MALTPFCLYVLHCLTWKLNVTYPAISWPPMSAWRFFDSGRNQNLPPWIFYYPSHIPLIRVPSTKHGTALSLLV